MHSILRNSSIERTTRKTKSAPVAARLIQELTFLSVSCNQTVTQAEIALASNPCLPDDPNRCSSELLLELAHQMAHQTHYLQFRQTRSRQYYATNIELNLKQLPELDEALPIRLVCTTTCLGFSADNYPTRIAVEVGITQGKETCCQIGFVQVSPGKSHHTDAAPSETTTATAPTDQHTGFEDTKRAKRSHR